MSSSCDDADGTNPCPLLLALEAFASAWKGQVLWNLLDVPRRFSELQAALPTISAKVLTQQLRQLERDGLVERRASDNNHRVDYALSGFGQTAVPVLDAIAGWSRDHGAELLSARERYDTANDST